MSEFGISYDPDTGELIVGDTTLQLNGRWQRVLLGQQNINFGNPTQWDSRATTWARNFLGRDDVFVHVIQTTPIPKFAIMLGATIEPAGSWWGDTK